MTHFPTERPAPPEVQAFPEGVDILVLPGFPDRDIEIEGEEGHFYPTTTIDVVKRLQQLDLRVEYTEPREKRLEYTLKAFELWLPVLQVAQQVFIGLGINQFVKALDIYRANREQRKAGAEDASGGDEEEVGESEPLLHVRIAIVREEDRETRWIDIDGKAEDVERALSKVQDELR